MNQQHIQLKPVEIKAFTLEEASDLLNKQDVTTLPIWQLHGEPIVVSGEIKQVMLKLDKIQPPTIVVPKPNVGGPILVS
jgi:hypothetical protein